MDFIFERINNCYPLNNNNNYNNNNNNNNNDDDDDDDNNNMSLTELIGFKIFELWPS